MQTRNKNVALTVRTPGLTPWEHKVNTSLVKFVFNGLRIRRGWKMARVSFYFIIIPLLSLLFSESWLVCGKRDRKGLKNVRFSNFNTSFRKK